MAATVAKHDRLKLEVEAILGWDEHIIPLSTLSRASLVKFRT
jgi:hypothetical protein